MNLFLGVVQWEDTNLFVTVTLALHHSWDVIKEDLEPVSRLVAYYEMKEATSTFELAFWKFGLVQADIVNNIDSVHSM